jgi:hypothetical protein
MDDLISFFVLTDSLPGRGGHTVLQNDGTQDGGGWETDEEDLTIVTIVTVIQHNRNSHPVPSST